MYIILLLPWEITSGLQTKEIGQHIYYFDILDSTQNFALQIVNNKNKNGTLIITKNQTNGKGRMNRSWFSDSGSICLSLIIYPKLDIRMIKFFPHITSLALAFTIEKSTKLKPLLKWPNDIMINNKKVGGILIDVSITSNKLEYVIIGIGINFKSNLNKLEKILKINNDKCKITSLYNYNNKTTSTTFIQHFFLELEKLFDVLQHNNINFIIQNWKRRTYT